MEKDRILIKGGRVVDPANNLDGLSDILVEGSCILRVAKNISAEAGTVIDAAGKIVIPGLVDMHAHLRQPGREDKETILSATLAALKGGVTSVLAMPNTNPTIDSPESIALLRGIIDKDARANVFICAAITKGRKGDELTDFSALKKEGAVALSDDGASVDDDAVMQEGFARAKNNKLTVICHSEDRRLSNNGLVNAGFTATRLGLRGISRESEYKRVSRDLTLAQKADAQVHITHLSCKESLELVAKAKKQGLRVSCDVTPHHLSLSEEAVLGYDTNFKMNPPLRAEGDIQAVKEGLARGVIDAIASDHAPHTENEKEIEFERAEFGVIGLETELAVSATELISRDILDWPGLVRKISFNPAQILGLDRGTLGVGRQADIVVFDPDKKWLVEKRGFLSKSTNSCFIGRRLKGIVKYTLYAGQVVYLHK